MLRIGFPKSTKENEQRIVLIPGHIEQIKNKHCIVIEEGYGLQLGYTDHDYENAGAMVADRLTVLNCEAICDPKIGDANYLTTLEPNKVLIGYFHAVQNRELTDLMLKNKHRCFAWEDMYKDGRHTFYRNNEIAGEAAILHAFTFFGKLPHNLDVALIGWGNVARGASRILDALGAKVVVYNRKTEQLLSKEIDKYDVIVNAVLWDTSRKDHIVSKDDIKHMKPDSLIIDISCDRAGAVETCIPTRIDNPAYKVEHVTHYCVDHTPSILYKEASVSFSEAFVEYLDDFIEGKEDTNEVITGSKIIDNGKIIDDRINVFQNR